MRRRFSSQFLGMNSTVVYENGYAYLVDPGVFPKETQHIKDFLQQEGIFEKAVLFTHTHGDHISGWQAFPNEPAYGHEVIAKKTEDMRNNDVRYLRGMWRKQGIENLDGLKFPDNIRYQPDGKFLEIPPYSFAFFHVPGHSIDMCAIIVPKENMMFSGDMLIQAPAPFILHSTRRYWTSLKRFKKLAVEYDIRCLVPGHGKPAKSPEEVLRRIRNEQEYLQQLVREGIKLAKEGVEGDELRHRLYSYSNRLVQLHSHQANVQTFIREKDLWLSDKNPDLSID